MNLIECPTPQKPVYYDRLFVESLVLQVNHNRGRNLEWYECVDHYHIRDKDKRNTLRHERERAFRKGRRKYQQLTIFDWMNELNGTQGS